MSDNWYSMTKEEREKYINQDQVPAGRELSITNESCDSKDWDFPWGANRSDFMVVYEMYFIDRKEVDEIAYHVDYSQSHIWRIIRDLRDGIEKEDIKEINKQILREHLYNRLSVMKVARKLKVNHPRVVKNIQAYIRKSKPQPPVIKKDYDY